MGIYILKTDLNEYLLAVSNGVAISTARKYEAKKFFKESDAIAAAKQINTKKKKWTVEKVG